MTSHANCPHPATSSARAACRRGGITTNTLLARDSEGKIRPAREANADKKAKAADANAKRTAAAKAKHPLKERSECYVCGSRAAHAEKKSGQPVCLKHIDNWDNITILPL